MAWLADSPSGVYRDHALSSTVRMQAYEDTVLYQFVQPEPGYGRGKGQSLTYTRIGKLASAGRVADTDYLPSVRPSVTTGVVSVSEWGAKTQLTEFEVDITHFELEPQLKEAFTNQISLTTDEMAATSLKATPIRYTPVTTGGVFVTNGTVTQIADKNLTVIDVQNIRDYLKRNLLCPYYANQRYVGCLSTTAARGIKNDPLYKDWFVFRPEKAAFVKSYVASFEDIDFYETNNDNVLDNSAGSTTVLGQALFFGADAARVAVIRDPELRMSAVKSDLGRFWELGWVGTLETFAPWSTATTGATTARSVYVTSA